MPRAGLDPEIVLRTGASIADSDGLELLTIAKLAVRLGVKAPSIYNHIRSLDCVKDDLTIQALQSIIDRTRDAMAGVAGRDALNALAHAQRQFAKEHPGLWAATNLPVAGWSESAQKAGQAYVGLVLAVLRGYGATGDQGVHAARFIRASLKGFIDLELGGGFGLSQDVDVSFTKIVDLLDAGLRSLSQEQQLDQSHPKRNP